MTDKNRTRAKTILASIAILLVATACRNPFVGMGARVDLNPPTGDVTNVSSGDYISGELTLSGTIDDDTDPYAVSAVVTDPLDGTVDETIAGTINDDGTWEILIPDTGAAEFGDDGQKNVTIVLQDSSERTTELEMVFFFDNTAPVVMVTSPDLDIDQSTPSFPIRGETYDPLGVATVTAVVTGPGGINTSILDDKNFGTPDAFYFTIQHDMASGSDPFEISLIATDKAGNTSVAMFHSADLAEVNDGDSITVIDLYNLKEGRTEYLTHLTDIVPAHLDYAAILPVALPSGSPTLMLWDDGLASDNPLKVPPFMYVQVDMDQDVPEITVTNPQDETPAVTVGPSYIVSGRVYDNVEVDPTTLEIRFLDDSGIALTDPTYAGLSDYTSIPDQATLVVPPDNQDRWYDKVDKQNYNFNYQLPGFDDTVDTSYTVQLRVEDNNGTPFETDPVPFFLDNNAPDLTIEPTIQGSSTNNLAFPISGEASDVSAGIQMEISIRDSENTNTEFITFANLTGNGSAQSWSYDISNWAGIGGVDPVETLNVTVRATSGGTPVTQTTYFTLDTLAPDIDISTPAEGESLNGAVTLRVFIDENSIDTVTRKVGIGAPIDTITTNKTNWSYAFSTYDPVFADPASSGYATETFPGSGLWDLPIVVTATDMAGNPSSVTRNIIIDNDGDRPEVDILYPLNDPDPSDAVLEGGIFGGEVTISGLSDDDDNFGIVDSVTVQIDLNTTAAEVQTLRDADWVGWEGVLFDDIGLVTLPFGGIDFDGNSITPVVTDIDEFVEYAVDGTRSWSLTLNSNGELYNVVTGHEGDIFLKFVAVDPENTALKSAPQLYHIKLDNTLPRIEKIRVNDNYSYGDTNFSGTIQLGALISDTEAITAVDISADYGDTWQDITYAYLSDWWNDLSSVNEHPVYGADYDSNVDQVVINFSINTDGLDDSDDINANNVVSGTELVTDGNGILVLKIRATDNNTPEGYVDIENIALNVDNDVPTTSMNAPGVLAGTARLQGSAQDPIGGSGNISGISHIEVYLGHDNGGGFMVYDPHPSSPSSYSFPPTPDGVVEMLTIPGQPYPVDTGNPLIPEDTGYLIIIDVDEDEALDPEADGDQDGYNEEIVKDGSNWDWWVDFDSTLLPDGDITVHYIVVDTAGNKEHYSQSGRIENSPPVISNVIMGTDVNNYDDLSNGTGVNTNVGEGESFLFTDGDDDGIIDTITIRNSSLYANATAQVGTGNGLTGNWEWSLRYKGVDPNHLGTGVSTTTITSGFAGDLDADPHYILSVTDEAGLTDSIRLNVNLDNTDGIAPAVILDNLTLIQNPKILDYDANGYAVPGYVPAVLAGLDPWASAEGRLRSAGSGVYDGIDADVSGKIIVSGTIYDANAIDRLELTIPGYDGGDGIGAPFGILEWFNPTVPNPLGGVIVVDGLAEGWTAYITSTGQSFDESSGHSVSWVFEFDTSDISTTAAANVVIVAEAYDRAGNVNTPDPGVSSDHYSIDIMPFIKDIRVSNSSYLSNNDIYRNKYGAWSIAEEAYLIIKGYNLGTTVGLVSSDSGDSTIPDLTTAITAANDLVVDTLSTSKEQLTAQVSGFVNSGWLVMEVGAATFEVPLMNYYGDFDENNIFESTWTNDSLWTDDRYFNIWDVTGEMAGSDNARWGSMVGDPVDGSYSASWSELSSAEVYLADQDGLYDADGIYYVYDPSQYTAVAVNDVGEEYVVYLADFQGGGTDWEDASGGLVLWGENADFWNYQNAWNYAPPYSARRDVYLEEVERYYEDETLTQFKNPAIAATGNATSTDIHLTYYDYHSKALKYAHFYDNGSDIFNQTFSVATNAAENDPAYIYTQYLEGNDDGQHPPTFTPAYTDPNIIAGDFGAPGDVGDNGSDIGVYSDIALDSAGRPVIVYYDTGNSSLHLIRATTTDPTDHDNSGATHWVDQQITDDFSYAGMYPSVTIEPGVSGRIHVSAYKVSTGDLMYYSADAISLPATGETYDFDDGDGNLIETVIDSDGNFGKYGSIDLMFDEDGVFTPVIGYLNTSSVGTFYGLKYAYLNVDGNWDHGTVPLQNPIADWPVSMVGVPDGEITPGGADRTNYSVGLGYISSSYRYARLRPELP